MATDMEVIWTAKAKITYFKVLEYLDTNWSKKEDIQFNQRKNIVINALRRNPGIFPFLETHKNIRRAICW